MDTMELTKIVGSICGALLALLLVAWGAETLYHVGGDGHGDGHGGEAKVAYVIEVEEDAGADSGDADVVPFADLLAAADIGKGEKVFGKCKACHKLEDGANGTGPHLYAIVDRPLILKYSSNDWRIVCFCLNMHWMEMTKHCLGMLLSV